MVTKEAASGVRLETTCRHLIAVIFAATAHINHCLHCAARNCSRLFQPDGASQRARWNKVA
jgi:hypothetical protein